MALKTFLLTSLLTNWAGAQVVPDITPSIQKKQLVYCDHLSGRINLYMDIHLNYNAEDDTFTNPEVAVFDATEIADFPKFPWAITVNFDPATNTSLIIMNKGEGNKIQFSIPSKNTGIVLEKTKDLIQPFNILAEGAFNGLELRSAPFSCYGAYAAVSSL